MREENPIGALLAAAVEHHRSGRVGEAETLYRQILALAPHNGDALNLLGLIAMHRGYHPAALELIAKAAALFPKEPNYQNNLGLALSHVNRAGEAEAHYRRALTLQPTLADAHHNLGDLLLLQNRLDEAGRSFREAVRYQPAHLTAWHNLAYVLMRQGDGSQAQECWRNILALNPGDAEAHCNLALALARAGRIDEAESSYREALKASPVHARSWNNLGNLLRRDRGESVEALACFREAVRLAPDYPDAHMGLGLALLSQGDMENGWREYEWRLRVPGYARTLPALPQWHGEEMQGKTLLLCAEQGLGDTIQFCRYAPLAAKRARVVFWAQPSLKRLLESLPGVEAVHSGGDMPHCDAYCAVASLPFLFGTMPETIPAQVPYLAPPADEALHWRKELAPFDRLKVGLAWAGNPLLPTDARRSIPPQLLAPLGSIGGAQFVSLQKDAAQLPPLPILDRASELADLAQTAALITALDLVISVDTAIAHLAGALGKPVWLLNRFDTDWRWLRGRDDSPWYPTLRQFRQPRMGDWEDVMARFAEQLKREVALKA